MYAFTKANFYGEADDYIIASISIQQHGSLDIREEDIDRLEIEFPNNLERVRVLFNSENYVKDVYGRQYPFYMGTYSISVLPLKIINMIFNLPQTYVFHISNVLYYSLAMLIVYFFFRQTRKNVFLTILLLAVSPTFVYISWASAEMFISSLMIVSLVFYTNGNRYLAALFTSIAATLNIVICGFGLIMILDYFISDFNYKNKEPALNAIKRNWKKTFGLAICFSPALITPLWNLYHYHKITPQLGMAKYDVFWINRFAAYLFDLNFGFLPYFPILLTLFFVVAIVGIYKKERTVIMLVLGFFTVVFLYSAMGHINSGMTAMARYNSWCTPFLVITVVTQYNSLFKNAKTHRRIALSLIVSAGTTFALTKTAMNYKNGSYTDFTPVAKFFLDQAPTLYNPNPFTFINRNVHIDGGYYYNATAPFIYYTDSGSARKILIPPKCNDPMKFFDFNLAANENDMNWLREQLYNTMANHANDWVYLNIDSNNNIIMKTDEISSYLNKLSNPNYLAIISVKDEASGNINEAIATEFVALGLQHDLRGQYRKSYIAVIDSGEVVYEELCNTKITCKEVIDNIQIEVSSAGYEVGNISEIKIDGINYSKNKRGINIVIYDKKAKAVVDSVAFDTHNQLQCFR